MPTKGIGMRRIIEKRFNVVLIDELCSKCHHELTNYKNIHRLLVCSHCKSNGLESKNITFMNRDMNACMNILDLSKQWINTKTRPEKYSRNSDYDSYLGEKHNPSVVFTADNAVNLKCTKTC